MCVCFCVCVHARACALHIFVINHRIHEEFFTRIKESNYKLMVLTTRAKKIELKAEGRMEPKRMGFGF